MKELTQQELIRVFSAYLPYNLKFIYSRDTVSIDNQWELIGLIERANNKGDFVAKATRSDYKNQINITPSLIKPILWDLSMLTKEITHEGETFNVLKSLRTYYPNTPAFKEYIDGCCDVFIPLLSSKVEYCIVEKLIEWHLNVFNLDESQYINKATCK